MPASPSKYERTRAELPDAGSGTRHQVTEHRLHEAVTVDLARDEQRHRRTAEAEVARTAVAQHSRAEPAALAAAATASVPFVPVPAVPLLGLVRPLRLDFGPLGPAWPRQGPTVQRHYSASTAAASTSKV
ncbi:hypothetical protein [Streptomyces chrestomyceticus]|uniref:hypothetical protein n=1 Tax=Streptomyces chrestomyceticus TaxID=68185 RepID=UPI0033E095E7